MKPAAITRQPEISFTKLFKNFDNQLVILNDFRIITLNGFNIEQSR